MSSEKPNSSINLVQILSVLEYCVDWAEKNRIVHERAYLSDQSEANGEYELKMTSLYELSRRVYEALREDPARPIEALVLSESEKLKYHENLTPDIIEEIVGINIANVNSQMSQKGIENSISHGLVTTIRTKTRNSL